MFQFLVHQNIEFELNPKQKQSVLFNQIIQIQQVSRSEMKSFSKTFSIPLSGKQFGKEFVSPQLLQQMRQVKQRQEQIMAQKLMRDQQIQQRLRRLEERYVEQAGRKQSKIKEKLQKSKVNRDQFLQKIVKRCKQKEIMYNEKMKKVSTKKKNSLRQAWKAATKFNEKVLSGKNIRHHSQDRHAIGKRQNNQQNLNKSVIIPDQMTEQRNSLKFKQVSVAGIGHSLKSTNLGVANRSLLRSQDQAVFQETLKIERRNQKYPRAIVNQAQGILTSQDRTNGQQQNNPESFYQQKLRKALVRHKHNMMQEQNRKIQQYGERIQKIHLSRRKRDQLHKGRIKKDTLDMEGYYEENERSENKIQKKSNQRLKSECQIYYRVKRASDWSCSNKQRRQKQTISHIQQGTQYLSENKVRHLKETISKNIAYNALQKKLYKERLRHF